ncbi:MAG: hypothetical protein IPI49_07515 [Myxococcales bacterium]|nr:hypothetical protein [Myxococcales bacterium]
MPARFLDRWRAFADLVALLLGINVWISVVVLPAVFVDATGGARLVLLLLPLAVLGWGLLRGSETVLLGLFPAVVLLPMAVTPAMGGSHVYGPVRFALVVAGVIAYLFGVSFFATFHEPPAPRSVRTLTSAQAGRPQRWRRRERVYWMMVAMSVLMPAILLAWVLFEPSIQSYLEQMYPGRLALMTTMLAVGAIALYLGVYHYLFLGVLRPHRTGDRDIVAALSQAQAEAKVGRPRLRFYVGVAIALGAMAVLLFARHL